MAVASMIYSLPCNAENCAADPITGKVYGVINQGSGMALDVSHESSAFGANVIQWPYKASDNQHFVISDTGNGYWTVQALHSGLVVDVERASVEPGSSILQWGYHGGENQQWRIERDGSDSFRIVSRRSGQLLTAGNNNAGANVYQDKNASTPYQRWYLNPVDGICNNADEPSAPVVSGCSGGNSLSAGESYRMVNVGGKTRGYFLHVPNNYSGQSNVPLIIDYHGYGGNGEGEKNWSGFDRQSESNGFIVAYPDGIGGTWNNRVPPNPGGEDDIGFARAIFDDLSNQGCIDSKRIYAAGYSMGGGMAYASACRAADLFAAVVSSSFDFYEDQQCNPSRPISVLSFRGKSDPLALYDGSVGPPGRFIGAKRTLEELVKINHCKGAPVNIGSGCEIYTQCDGGVHEGLCSIEFGGHLTGDPKLSWDFLSQFEKK